MVRTHIFRGNLYLALLFQLNYMVVACKMLETNRVLIWAIVFVQREQKARKNYLQQQRFGRDHV